MHISGILFPRSCSSRVPYKLCICLYGQYQTQNISFPHFTFFVWCLTSPVRVPCAILTEVKSLVEEFSCLYLAVGTKLQERCHGMTSLPLLCSPLATSDPFHLHSTSSASTPLQPWCVLVQLCHAHSRTNWGSMPDPFGPGSHARGCCLYTLSTSVLFAWSFFIDNSR